MTPSRSYMHKLIKLKEDDPEAYDALRKREMKFYIPAFIICGLVIAFLLGKIVGGGL